MAIRYYSKTGINTYITNALSRHSKKETNMTELYAKPIVDGKFWIVEQDGNKVATLHKK